MIVMPIYGKRILNSSSLELKDIGMEHWGLWPYEIC